MSKMESRNAACRRYGVEGEVAVEVALDDEQGFGCEGHGWIYLTTASGAFDQDCGRTLALCPLRFQAATMLLKHVEGRPEA